MNSYMDSIHIATFTGKGNLMKHFGIWCLILLLYTASAAQDPVWMEDFSGQIPGMSPRNWKCFWGTLEDDLVIISNLHTLSGKAMVIDRSGNNPKMWAYGTKIAGIPDGTAVLRIPFRLEDGGVNSSFGIEIGTLKGRYVSIGFQKRRIRIFNRRWKLIADLGPYQIKKWYRIVLYLPTLGNRQAEAFGRLESYDDGCFKQTGNQITFRLAAPSAPYGTLIFVANPPMKDSHKFKVYFDRLELLRAP